MSENVYKIIEIVGSSEHGLDDAIRGAIARASKTLTHIGWFEVARVNGHVVDGEIRHFQVTLKVGFRLEGASD